MIPNHKQLPKLDSNNTQMDYDATSLYHSAMWDEKSVYPKIETGFAFKLDMNDNYVEAFNNQSFNQDDNESAKLKTKTYNPCNLIFQLLPVREKVKKSKLIE